MGTKPPRQVRRTSVSRDIVTDPAPPPPPVAPFNPDLERTMSVYCGSVDTNQRDALIPLPPNNNPTGEDKITYWANQYKELRKDICREQAIKELADWLGETPEDLLNEAKEIHFN